MGRRGNGEGSIEKRPDGTYHARLRIGDGKRRSFYGKTRKEVQAKLQAARREMEAGRLPVAPNMKVGAYLDLWLDSRQDRVGPSTHENYRLNVERVRPFLGSVRLEALRHTHIVDCYKQLQLGTAPAPRPLCERTVHQVHRVLKVALRHALKCGYISYNPMDLVEPPKPAHKEMQALTPDQVEILFSHTNGHRHHALWMLLVTCGLRIGEATALTWEDLDLDGAGLIVRRTLHRQKGKGLVLGAPKTAQSRRSVDIPPRTVAALRRHRVMQHEQRLLIGDQWKRENLVFSTETGGPLDPGYLNKALHRDLEACSLPRVRVHDLRHTFATLALQQGVGIKGVQNALGHSSAKLTLDTYAHVTRDMRKEAASAMDRLFPLQA